MIQRILANLLDNAIKYTPSGGAVKVSLSEKDGREALVTVHDTGIGIPADDLPISSSVSTGATTADPSPDRSRPEPRKGPCTRASG